MTIVSGREKKDHSTSSGGIGYAISSGSSLFYTRSTNPFKTHSRYLSVGLHIEEEGLALPYYNYYYDTIERNATQEYYLESGVGYRRLLLQDKMDSGFLPHVALEGGLSGYIAQVGDWRDFFSEFAMKWSPLASAGLGVSIFTGQAIYRAEMGFVSIIPLLPEDLFRRYGGFYLKVIIAGGTGRRGSSYQR